MDIALFMSAAESAKQEIDRVEREIDDKQRELRLRKTVGSALRGLRSCWSDGYAGKYGPHWFFVRDFSATVHEKSGRKHIEYTKFWVADIANDPAKFREHAAAGKVPHGSFSDAKSVPCGCGRNVPVIGRYEQTEDSFAGDTWQLELYALCLHCPSLAGLGEDFKASYHY